MLTALAPYRETGHCILLEALERRGNVAEALLAYERLRFLLRDELGIAPSPTLQAVHRRLLRLSNEG
jgi:DNA-binding SARP family transcriptional activator